MGLIDLKDAAYEKGSDAEAFALLFVVPFPPPLTTNVVYGAMLIAAGNLTRVSIFFAAVLSAVRCSNL